MLNAAAISSIKSRISKLEAVTTQRGATPSEAQNAAKMAARLRAKLPPEAPRRQAQRPQPAQDTQAMWGMFRRAMDTSAGSTLYHPPHFEWDQIREQSVLNDLDAFLGNGRTGKVRF